MAKADSFQKESEREREGVREREEERGTVSAPCWCLRSAEIWWSDEQSVIWNIRYLFLYAIHL